MCLVTRYFLYKSSLCKLVVVISISALLAEPVSKAKSTLFLLLIFNINIYSIYSLISDFGKGGFTLTSGFWFCLYIFGQATYEI